jgi:hypothetical protein
MTDEAADLGSARAWGPSGQGDEGPQVDGGPLAVAISGEDWLQVICPFLRASDGSWRSAGPARDHRCWAAQPPSELPVLTQQRLCLVKSHNACERFLHARELRSAAVVRERSGGQQSVVTPAPSAARAEGPGLAGRVQGLAGVVLASPRMILAAVGVLLGGVVLLALLAVGGGAGPDVTGSPALRSSQPVQSVSPSGRPGGPSPTSSDGVRRYRVRAGDTLRTIADRFGVSVRQIRAINDLGDPPRLQPDVVILIPPPN